MEELDKARRTWEVSILLGLQSYEEDRVVKALQKTRETGAHGDVGEYSKHERERPKKKN